MNDYKNRHYKDYIDSVTVDPALYDRIKQTAESPSRKGIVSFARLAPKALAGLAAVLLIGVIWAIPGLLRNMHGPYELGYEPGEYIVSGPLDLSTLETDIWEMHEPQDGILYFNAVESVNAMGLPPRREMPSSFTRDLTEAQMSAVFPSQRTNTRAIAIYWPDGTLEEVVYFSAIPPIGSQYMLSARPMIVVAENRDGDLIIPTHGESQISNIHGIEVVAYIAPGQGDYFVIAGHFVVDNLYYRVITLGATENVGKARLNELVISIITGTPADLSVLAHPEIPEMRDEWLTLEEAEHDPDFGAFLPVNVPRRFGFTSARRLIDQFNNFISMGWGNTDEGYFGWQVLFGDEYSMREHIVSTDDRHKFDVNHDLYTPLAVNFPQRDGDIWRIFASPIFMAEEFSFDIVKARAYWDTTDSSVSEPHWLIYFSVMYDDIVVRIFSRGLTPEEVYAMLQR